jgi:hypothetical protein
MGHQVEDGADRRPGGRAESLRVHAFDLADPAEMLFEGDRCRVATFDEPDAERSVALEAFEKANEIFSLPGADRQRLLDQHVVSALRCVPRLLGEMLMWHGDAHNVKLVSHR